MLILSNTIPSRAHWRRRYWAGGTHHCRNPMRSSVLLQMYQWYTGQPTREHANQFLQIPLSELQTSLAYSLRRRTLSPSQGTHKPMAFPTPPTTTIATSTPLDSWNKAIACNVGIEMVIAPRKGLWDIKNTDHHSKADPQKKKAFRGLQIQDVRPYYSSPVPVLLNIVSLWLVWKCGPNTDTQHQSPNNWID